MSHEKPTLIILTPGFAADETDSTCLPPDQTFVSALKENFPELTIIILAFHYPFTNKTYHWRGVKVIPFNGYKKRKGFRLLQWMKILRELKKIHNYSNIIGLLSFWCGECALVGKRFGRKKNIKHVCWLKGQDARKGNRYAKWVHPISDELVALSDFLQSEFEKNYGTRPAHVICPGIDPRDFPGKAPAKDIDIMGAGSLIPLKQFNIFLDVIYDIKKQYPGIKAVICGKGPEEKKLRAQIERLQLQDNIELLGEIPHPEVLQLMQRCKLFLHPSSYEGFGVVCLEALNAGTHVISFCRIMNNEIPHWHIVDSPGAMSQKALEILGSPQTEYDSVLPYTASESAKKIMQLFNK